MGEVIVVTSGKGGTGKTQFATNFGATLAKRNKKVVLIDMDLGLRNMDLYLGLESKVVFNVMDVLSGVCKIKRALIKDKRFPELYLLAASPYMDDRDITTLHMEVLCSKLKERFDYVIIDAPAGVGEGLAFAAAGASKAIIVTEAEYASARDADAVNRALNDLGIDNVYCIVNKVRAELMSMGLVPSIEDITRGIRSRLAGIIQYDENVLIAANQGVPIVLKKGTYIEKNFNNIVDRIVD